MLLLSRIQNNYIVRYYNTWIETVDDPEEIKKLDFTDSEEDEEDEEDSNDEDNISAYSYDLDSNRQKKWWDNTDEDISEQESKIKKGKKKI